MFTAKRTCVTVFDTTLPDLITPNKHEEKNQKRDYGHV